MFESFFDLPLIVVGPPLVAALCLVGGQIGLTCVPWNAALNFHYFHEFAAEDRFQGESIGLNFAIKF